MNITERIFHALFINRNGMTCHELADEVYRDDPEGGPLWAWSSIGVLIHDFNRKTLMPLGFKIASETGSHRGAKRRLVKL